MTTVDAERLRAAALRVTRPRLAVLGVLVDHPHVDTETVIRRLRTSQRACVVSGSPSATSGTGSSPTGPAR